MSANKLSNGYVQGFFGEAEYLRIPKAVWAAIAISYAMRNGGEDFSTEIYNEWQALYDNRIVPQRPAKR